MRYTGINHLAMATNDIGKTVRFWRDLLGMKLVLSLGRPGYRQYFFEISENDLLAFFEWQNVEPVQEKDAGRDVRGPFVFDHVSFGVQTAEDLRALKDRIDAAGFWVSEVIDNGFILSVFSFDPNGIALEFSCPLEGIDIRSRPLLADASPPRATEEGSEPQEGHWPKSPAGAAGEERAYPGELGRMFREAMQRKGENR